jgi:hypothetical protein
MPNKRFHPKWLVPERPAIVGSIFGSGCYNSRVV